MLPLRMLGSLMFIFLLCDADSMCPIENNPLILDPPEVIGEYGDSVLVNCTSSDMNHTGMHWMQTVNNVEKPLSENEIDSFINCYILLSDWSVTAKCKIQLKDYECSKDLEIIVYKTPDTVSVSARDPGPMVEGTDFLLKCDIINVAPVQKLKVKWYRGNETLHTEMFNDTTVAPVNVSSVLRVTPVRDYNAAIFRCEAELHFGPKGPELIPTSSSPYTAVVHYAPELKSEGDINVTVNEGNDVTLNCEAEGNPPPVFHWTCDGVNFTVNTNNLNITQVHTSATYSCKATNYLGNIIKQIHVHVIKTTTTTALAAMTSPAASAPRGCHVILSPDELVVRFGDPASVNCSTSATNVSGMGWEAAVGGTGFKNPPTVTWTVKKLTEWSIKPECYITRNDNSQCFVSPAITVYKTPDIMSVSARDPSPMVEGTDFLLECDIINVAPVQKLKVKWYRGNGIVHTEIFNDTRVAPVNVSSVLRVTPVRDYNASIFRCEAELHFGPKGPELTPTSSSPYTAVVHYKPQIQACPEHYTGVENEFRIDMLSCHADGKPAPTVQWYYQGEPINASEPLTRTHSGKYTAEFENYLGKSNTSVDITIEYSPSFTCNDRYEVEEHGKLQTDCEPKGIPKSVVTWFKDGKIMASPHWTKNDSGKYLLKVTNKHGTASHTLYIDVLYAPVFKEGNYSKEVTQGENVTFHCHADGNPTPKIHWNYIDAGNARVTTGGHQTNISITGATSTNAGVYICVASNSVGHVTRSVTLIMKGQTITGLSPLIWGLIFLSLIVIIIIIIIIFFHSRSKKQGQYSFVPDKAKDGSGIPMTTQSNGVQS
ncbi:hemicentin-1-like isoform X1 [Micropterus dolomieu]|uniref:hemicentin-1-like isoform X1 n=1 Tax=Micropterus dolomieu TaxID=147949 RepID=UPI001E8CB447|nr:hemicentin-1-like isoform X1 [Micropterus dolomieu]